MFARLNGVKRKKGKREGERERERERENSKREVAPLTLR